ncbi:DEAD/DEAH box helicase [Streptomyces sp. NPDC056670]|uniref:DEAD/DEAH box helicase n=1 Tax=Streptomyces sp. NPDC056670 TaxID=3345904 RepID=UPI00369FC767
MDVFRAHEQLIEDYDEFTRSLVWVRDPAIRAHLKEERDRKTRWPDPWISLNPMFRKGGTVAELTEPRDGEPPVLASLCAQYFRDKQAAEDVDGREDVTLTLHYHQKQAVEIAASPSNSSYVLTTGTGSGKSLSYLLPIVNEVLKHPRPGTISAIIVYPMNALANSQMEELKRYLEDGVPEADRKVTFARYTGQEKLKDKKSVLATKPDILLTNYMMLEYLLTRPDERKELIAAAKGLRFLVLDELHTYRGRQGADVGVLVRRLRDACEAPDMRCIGTSATMATAETFEEARTEVADVATRLFGTTVEPDNVIGETLERATDPGRPLPPEEHRAALLAAVHRTVQGADSLPKTYQELKSDPFAVWVEDAFGLEPEPGHDTASTRRLRRRAPIQIPEAARQLRAACGAEAPSAEDCGAAIRTMLEVGARTRVPGTTRPLFAFRLHQFLSKGDTVYASLEPVAAPRHLTSQYQLRVPGHQDQPLVPLHFCRECGHDYPAVTYDSRQERYFARKDPEAPAEAGDGYLFVDEERPWPSDPEEVLDRLPASWIETDDNGRRTVVKARKDDLPVEVWLSPQGRPTTPGTGLHAWWIRAPFRFCPRCRVGYEQLRVRDFAKLATFSAEGRSSAVSLVASSVVRSLRGQPDLKKQAQKLLTFVDNRQDASLQAGHFNDFVQVTQIRGALYRALEKAGGTGLRHDMLPQAVAEALDLPLAAYAQGGAEVKYGQLEDTKAALRAALTYRVYNDLERGWRLTMPNLSQTGLLRFDYTSLSDIAADTELWRGTHWALENDDPAHREELARALLDELRRALAVNETRLTKLGHEQLVAQSKEHLVGLWAVPEADPRSPARVAYAGPRPKRSSSAETVHFSARGGYGRYLRRPDAFAALPLLAGGRMAEADADVVIRDLLRVLHTAGLLKIVEERPDGALGYQLKVSSLIWLPGDGETAEPDPVRKTFDPGTGGRVNRFFRDLYRDAAGELRELEAREHTAQVETDLRIEREKGFRSGDLPLLFCSPTMELGVDIAELNAVTMRNVPPTPANYAQRSGRAGRSGQPALVTTYCSTGSAHDQYYFRRPQLMVSGSVVPPRIDLTNEDLLRSHIHAVWLAETGAGLGHRMTDILDVAAPSRELGGPLPLPLAGKLRQGLERDAHRRNAITRCTRILAPLREDLAATSWWYEGWIEDQVRGALRVFDEACDRWRRLYRNAHDERDEQDRRANDSSVTLQERRRARARRIQAEQQLDLLCNDTDATDGVRSDFYSYRYFASEGFLPGYSFPRLPLAAYVPGEPGESRYGQKHGAYIQRPRFIAIGEFGPGALIYHEGRRYTVSNVQVPMGETPGSIATVDAKVCGECGYWHDNREKREDCLHCRARLVPVLRRLMQLTTVYAEPRRRISSDEEERLREPFDLKTAYRFHHGKLTARFRPENGGAEVAEVAYGDAAVYVINLGRRGRRARGDEGFWLDPVTGRWLSDSKAAERAETSAEQEALGTFRRTTRTEKVVPYADDTKNIAVLRLAVPVDPYTAATLRYALERGIEAHFQLEDAELQSEDLPDPEDRARMLFVEGAEGGAGVLRLLHDDSSVIAKVATKALEIIHYEKADGEWRDRGHAKGAREVCEFGCYDCLLTYHNQPFHPMIRRQTAVALLIQLAECEAVKDQPQAASPAEQAAALASRTSHAEGGGFVEWLTEHGYRLPDETGEALGTARAVPDFVYRLPDADVAVFLDLPRHGVPDESRDTKARTWLGNRGWLVIEMSDDSEEEWHSTVRTYPNVFGPGRTPR